MEGCDNLNNTDSEFYPSWINNTIPWDQFAKRPGFSRCYMYNHTWKNVDECILGDKDILIENQVKTCDDQWIYDTSIFSSTIFTEVQKLFILRVDYFLTLKYVHQLLTSLSSPVRMNGCSQSQVFYSWEECLLVPLHLVLFQICMRYVA